MRSTLDLWHAVRPIPPGRWLARLRLRLKWKQQARSSEATRMRLLQQGRAGAEAAPVPALGQFARQKQHFLEATALSITAVPEPHQLELKIHGLRRAVDPAAPLLRDDPSLPKLWHMTLSYLPWLLDRQISAAPQRDALLSRIVEFYTSRELFAAPGVFDIEWHPYSVSQRLVNLVAVASLPDALGDDARARLEQAIGCHHAYLRKNCEYDLHYNHLAKNIFALMVAELYMQGSIEPDDVREYLDVLEYQLLSDGSHAELCPMYHLLQLADLIQLATLRDALPETERQKLREQIRRMFAAAETMQFSGGDIALLSDSWLGEAPPLAVLRAAYLDSSSMRDSETISEPVRPIEPNADPMDRPVQVDALPDAGLTRIAASGVELIIDHGSIGAPDNPGHGHDDALTIELAVNGIRWIVDPGVAAYAPGEARDWTRRRDSHNAPTFDGEFDAKMWGSYRVGRRAEAPTRTRHELADGWQLYRFRHPSLSDPRIVTERAIAACDSIGIAILDYIPQAARARHPRSRFILRQSLDWLSEQGYAYAIAGARGAIEVDGAVHYDMIGIERSTSALKLVPDDEHMVLLIGRGATLRQYSSDLLERWRSTTAG